MRKLLLIKKLSLFVMLMSGIVALGQTNPTAQTLPYTQNFSGFTGSTTTYPAGWQGWDISGSLGSAYTTTAPSANRALTAGTNASSTRGVYDMNAKLGIISTGSSISTAALAIVTTGQTNISVSYKAGTQRTENTRQNALGLQYRVGTSGAFTDVASSEYQNQMSPTNTTGTNAVKVETITVTLPAAAENKAVVQLRWVIREISGTGNRPAFSIDDVSVSAGTATPTLTASSTSLNGFTYVSGGGPSASQNFTVSGSSLTADLTVNPTTSDYEIATAAGGPYGSSLSFTPSSGTVSAQTIHVRLKTGLSVGSYNGSVEVKSTGAATKTVSLTGSVTNPVPTASIAGTLSETTLNGGTVVVTIANDTFIASPTASNFALTGAPTGTTIASVNRDSATQVTLTLAYVTTNDFDSDATMGVTVQAGALVTNSTSSVAAGNSLTVTAVAESFTLSPTSLTGLNYFVGSGPSAAQSFTVSSSNLSPGGGTVSLTATSNIEISVTDATSGFGASASLTYTGTGTFASNTVWVRLKSGLAANTYSQTVTVSGGKASASLAASGTVTTPPPANDNCAGATALSLNAAAVTGTLQGATQTIAAASCGGNSDDDVWFSFTTTAAGNYIITADGNTTLDLVVDLRSGACDGTSVTCADDTIDGTEVVTASLDAATTYYVRVYEYGANTGLSSYTFTINVEEVLVAPVATAATNVTPSSFQANWNTTATAASYVLDVFKFSTGYVAPWINEFHYDNSGTDTNEFVEIIVPAGYNGTSLTLSVYNGGDGAVLSTHALSTFTAGTSNSVYTVYSKNISGLQNDTEGFALSDSNGLIQFISYEGTFTAASGPASGQTSVNVGFVEGTSTPANSSIHLEGTGPNAGSFTWAISSGANTKGAVNSGQTINPPYEYVLQNTPIASGSFFSVTGLTADTQYYYVVRAVNGTAVSPDSSPISVTTGKNNVWNGSAWTAGTAPTGTDAAVIQGNFNTGTNTGLSNVYDLVVNSGTLTIAGGTTVTVTNQVTNNGGTIIAQNNGNLVQVNNVSNSGNVTVNRDSSPLYRQDYTLWSSPVAGATLGGFSPNTLTNRFYTYNTNTDQYAAISASSSFSAGKGYLIRMPNGAFGADNITPAGTFTSTAAAYQQGTDTMIFNGAFTGVPNNGDIPVTLTDAVNGFNLVGNPYPSPINVSTFLNANNAVIDGTVWIWRKKNASTEGSAYVTINAAGAYSGNGQPEAENPGSIIRQGQGFIVKVKDGNTSDVVTFTNSMRSSDTSNQFFRNANTTAQMGMPERHGVRINLNKSGQIVSQLYAGYISGATLGADNGIDSRYINDNATVLDMVIDGADYIIQGRPLPFSPEDVVPLNLKAAAAGTYSISLNDAEGLFAGGQDVFIKDKLTGAIQNLNQGSYSFTTDAGTFANRFELVYSATALGTEHPEAALNSVVVYQNASGIAVVSGNLTIKEVTVYDVRGRQVYAAKGINANSTVLTGVQPAQQLLIVEVVTEAGKTTRKVVY